MKTFLLLATLTAAAILQTNSAQAQVVRAVKCDGCTLTQSTSVATAATDSGTVYVFNIVNPSVYKYRVTTDDLASETGTAVKRTVRLATESDLVNSYRDFATSWKELAANSAITLPPDFPIRSVAGALLDPDWASTTLEDYLASSGGTNQLITELNVLLAHLLKVKIPVIDTQSLVGTIKIKFEFPDGSSIEYQVSFAINALSAQSRMELDKPQNARLPDGTAAPSSKFGLRNFTITDTSGSIEEWRAYAGSLGASWDGTGSITCSIQNDVTLTCKYRSR